MNDPQAIPKFHHLELLSKSSLAFLLHFPPTVVLITQHTTWIRLSNFSLLKAFHHAFFESEPSRMPCGANSSLPGTPNSPSLRLMQFWNLNLQGHGPNIISPHISLSDDEISSFKGWRSRNSPRIFL